MLVYCKKQCIECIRIERELTTSLYQLMARERKEEARSQRRRDLKFYSPWLASFEKYAHSSEGREYLEMPGQYSGDERPIPERSKFEDYFKALLMIFKAHSDREFPSVAADFKIEATSQEINNSWKRREGLPILSQRWRRFAFGPGD